MKTICNFGKKTLNKQILIFVSEIEDSSSEAREKNKNILMQCVKAGFTPDCAESPEKAKVLEGSFHFCEIAFN